MERAGNDFDKAVFVKLASRKLNTLEFKERSNQICTALESTLPANFRQASKQLIASLHPDESFELTNMDSDKHGVRGWGVMPMAEFIARQGLQDFDFSMGVLKQLTKKSSSEFAVRRFIVADQDRALRHVRAWATDTNYHVRRLASEGTRPRLPWAVRLPMFMQDPTPIIAVLELLKDDDEEYVRRSVANSLNDIAKDHPAVVADIAQRWVTNADVNRQRLVRHACRTLVKHGHKSTLKALGYTTPKIALNEFDIRTPRVKFGNSLEFSVSLTSTSRHVQPLIIDYVIHHQKSNGKTSPKVFKLRTTNLSPKQKISINKKHSIKPITTRTYYAGLHRIEIQINGECLGHGDFELVM